jgi:hypothetical protein
MPDKSRNDEHQAAKKHDDDAVPIGGSFTGRDTHESQGLVSMASKDTVATQDKSNRRETEGLEGRLKQRNREPYNDDTLETQQTEERNAEGSQENDGKTPHVEKK